MKEITIKLSEKEAEELEIFAKSSGLTRSKFIERLIRRKMSLERKEKLGWMMLAEKSMAKIWDNPKDDKVWVKYLDND